MDNEYSTFEKIGIRNEVNKIICPFVKDIERTIVEIKLSLDREEPNVEMSLRRVGELENLVRKLEERRMSWNREF